MGGLKCNLFRSMFLEGANMALLGRRVWAGRYGVALLKGYSFASYYIPVNEMSVFRL